MVRLPPHLAKFSARLLLAELRRPEPNLKRFYLSDAVTDGLLEDVDATIQYVTYRLEHEFKDKAEVGAHARAFMDISGLTVNHLLHVDQKFGLRTKRYTSANQRDEEQRRIRDKHYEKLDAAVRYIAGEGTMPELEEELGVAKWVIFKLVHRLLRPHGLTPKMLAPLSLMDRENLAHEIRDEYRAVLRERFRHLD